MRKKISMKKWSYLFVLGLAGLLILPGCFKEENGTPRPIPADTRQLILVITPSVDANQGTLYRYRRQDAEHPWMPVEDPFPVSIGRNGLAWGRGLHQIDESQMPLKKEGDGKSPAGVFRLGTAFGQLPPDSLPGLTYPYLYLQEGVECVDDPQSRYYNQMVNRGEVDTVDWKSSEKMWHPGIWYQLGVVVEHNKSPVKKGAGSCIFLHNWSTPGETTAGCTAMEPENLRRIVYWLKQHYFPVLVQLPKNLYLNYQEKWELPVVP